MARSTALALVEEAPHYERSSPTLLAAQPASPPDIEHFYDPDWGDLWTHLEARLAMLRNWRLSWWEHWSLLARFILPRRYHWLITANTMVRGFPINQEIVDSTGTLAMRTCASGMTSGLCSATHPWFKLKAGIDRNLEIDAEAAAWLEEVENRMYAVMAESNFYKCMGQMFEDMTVFGTGVIIFYEDEENVVRGYNPCAGEYYLGASSQFEDNTLYRQFTLTVAQIIDMFGVENCPADIQQLWATKGAALETERVIAHAIEPNFAIRGRYPGSSVRLVGEEYTWREVYWVWGQQNERPLSKRGFYERPFIAARWQTVSNDAYGRSPGMDALPDIMQLQTEQKRKAEAIEKQVRPPLLAHAELKNQPSSILPGHITYVSQVDAGKGMRPIYEVAPDLAGMLADIKECQDRINRAFFTDIFLMISQMEGIQPRNELEIYERKGEKIQVLGPVIEAFQSEGGSPAVVRIFEIMRRRGMFPPMPESLARLPLQIDYISEMAMAQRAAATGSIERFVATIGGNLGAVYPEARDLINPDRTGRHYASLLNVPVDILNSPEEVRKLRANRAQAQQQQALTAAAGAAIQGAQTLSQTPVGGGNTALDQVLGTGGGGAGPAAPGPAPGAPR